MSVWVLVAIWILPTEGMYHVETLQGVYGSRAACEAALPPHPVVKAGDKTLIWECVERQVQREEYCGQCGQIGCTHDGLDREG